MVPCSLVHLKEPVALQGSHGKFEITKVVEISYSMQLTILTKFLNAAHKMKIAPI